MKDYYAILGVDKKADLAEIKKQYRKRAMVFHPDRNPDNPEAELKFKELAEAYGVLTDPVKKKEYDRYKATGFGSSSSSQGAGFHYSQEDILKDLFNDPRFKNMFQTLIRDFQRSGFRGDSRFFKQTMFGGKGRLFGSLLIFGSMAGAKMVVNSSTARGGGKRILGTIVKSITSLLTRAGDGAEKTAQAGESFDLHYDIHLSSEELFQGKWIQVLTGETGEKIRVKIPAHSTSGRTLRVKNKGKVSSGSKRGHLFLHL